MARKVDFRYDDRVVATSDSCSYDTESKLDKPTYPLNVCMGEVKGEVIPWQTRSTNQCSTYNRE